MSNSQCRKLSTNLRLEARFLIINANIQNRGDISIKTYFIYAKSYSRKMFYSYAFWGVIKKKQKQWFQCDFERLFFLHLTPLPSQLNSHHCLQATHYILFLDYVLWLSFRAHLYHLDTKLQNRRFPVVIVVHNILERMF